MGTIFISYRRDDSGGHTGRLFDVLSERFGNSSVFRDIEDLEPGVDFVEALDKALGKCDVLLPIIGRTWVTMEGPKGRRLDQADDFVRIEIAKALERNVRVIPVLVAGATMPGAEDLPDNLQALTRRNAIELSDTRWDYDIGRLCDVLAKVLGTEESVPARDPTAVQSKSGRGFKLVAALAAVVVLVGAGAVWMWSADSSTQRTSAENAEAAVAAEVRERQTPDAQVTTPAAREPDPPARTDDPPTRTQITPQIARPSAAIAAPLSTELRTATDAIRRSPAQLTAAIGVQAELGFGTDGQRVRQVSFGDPATGQAQGHFMVSGPLAWVETGASLDDVRFRFREVGRDDWSVYLEDPTRNMSIQLDLFTKQVSFGDIGAGRAPLYDIVGAE